MAKRKAKAGSYQVVDGTSVRLSTDPTSPDFETWLHWSPGDVATHWPEHADVAGWVASGHWVPAEPAEPEEED